MATVPINKSSLLKKENNKTDYIALKLIKRHLDRLQLSVKEQGCIYKKLIYEFKSVFKYLGSPIPKKPKTSLQKIEKFKYKKISLNVIRYITLDYNVKYRFSISISNPDEEIQKIVCDILAKLIPDQKIRNKDVSVSEAEFALDLYPENLSDLYPLASILDHSVVMNHSRKGAYKEYQGKDSVTKYRGNKGNVRKGSKGLRCYLKPRKAPIKFRIELQVNKKKLRNRGINIFSLPLSADRIDVFDYITFRYGLNIKTLPHLARIKIKKQRPNFLRWPPQRKIMLANITESLIFREINEYGAYPFYFDDSVTKPVAAQIDVFKEYKAELKFSNQVNELFPINKLIMEDIRNMRVRRHYYPETP